MRIGFGRLCDVVVVSVEVPVEACSMGSQLPVMLDAPQVAACAYVAQLLWHARLAESAADGAANVTSVHVLEGIGLLLVLVVVLDRAVEFKLRSIIEPNKQSPSGLFVFNQPHYWRSDEHHMCM